MSRWGEDAGERSPQDSPPDLTSTGGKESKVLTALAQQGSLPGLFSSTTNSFN